MTDEDSYSDYMGTTSAPVAVQITASTPLPIQERPTRQWTCGQVQCREESITQLAGGHPSRVRLVLTNIGDQEVILAPDQPTCTGTSGYPLAAGATLELNTRHPIYALGATVVAFIAEHLDG